MQHRHIARSAAPEPADLSPLGTQDAEEGDDIVAEDWPTFYTQVPVWVLLSGCTAQAYKLYAFLSEHINSRTTGRRIAWPKGDALARALGLKDYRKAARYCRELEALGAMRIEEIRYAGGMRRRNRYHVRFNPPATYQGLLSLSQFYEANPDVRSPSTKPSSTKSAGHTGGTQKDTTAGAQEGTADGPAQGVTGGTVQGTAQLDQHQLDPGERETAPSARSAADARRASAGRPAPGSGGSAASGISPSSPARLTRAERDAVSQVEAGLPAELRALLPARRPRPLRDTLVAELAQRSTQQLIERADRRWYTWGFAAAADTRTGGRGLNSPVGVAIRLLREGECPDPRCEDGTVIDSGAACPRCAERSEDRRSHWASSAPATDGGAQMQTAPPMRTARTASPPTAPAAAAELPVAPCPGWGSRACGRNSPATGGLCTRCRARSLATSFSAT